MIKAAKGNVFSIQFFWRGKKEKPCRFWTYEYYQSSDMLKCELGFHSMHSYEGGNILIKAEKFEPDTIDLKVQEVKIEEIKAPLWLSKATPLLSASMTEEPSEYLMEIMNKIPPILNF